MRTAARFNIALYQSGALRVFKLPVEYLRINLIDASCFKYNI
jgi:hypothetical protein